ncbi:hypothetical protein KVR01_011530 [Diaporthe batatas]|uniref:uncharacterized protein n=1 Tax=Diaporthe batatas TaxID=748121 RepID=UPI001D04B10B|nr:uncharacterized protein KVR01_011530 [Diaporthe batatas]KAG8158408.1 hypothetical protein KVR01_011530 [Diaporthe batatas]
MAPPPGGSSRGFSTSSVRKWQYTFAQALNIAGPRFPKTSRRTQVAVIPGSPTMLQVLPVALRLREPPRFQLPDIRGMDNGVLDSYVAHVNESNHQSTLLREADVIQEAGKFFVDVAASLAPYYLARYGLNGRFDCVRENAFSGSAPDLVFRYNGRDILALDYKGPNCINENELLSCCATSVGEALEAIRGKKASKRQQSDPSLVSGVNQWTEGLLKQGLKYASNRRVSTVLFYDYDYLLAMRPPRGLDRGNNLMLMDVTICPEYTKSTEDGLVAHSDNHAIVLLRYLIMAAQECEEKSAGSSSRSKKK